MRMTKIQVSSGGILWVLKAFTLDIFIKDAESNKNLTIDSHSLCFHHLNGRRMISEQETNTQGGIWVSPVWGRVTDFWAYRLSVKWKSLPATVFLGDFIYLNIFLPQISRASLSVLLFAGTSASKESGALVQPTQCLCKEALPSSYPV